MAQTRPLWNMAYRNLLRNRRRTFATMTAVIFGFVGLLLLSAYIYRVAMGTRAMTVYAGQKGHVAVLKTGALEGFGNKPWRFILEADDQKKIQDAVTELGSGVEFTGKFLSGFGLLTDEGHSAPVMITAVEPDLYPRLVSHPELVRWTKDWLKSVDRDDAAKMKSAPTLISVTPSLAQGVGRMGTLAALPEAQRAIQILATNYFKDVNAVDAELGITHRTGNAFAEDMSLIAPLPLLQNLYATEGVEYLALFLTNPLKANGVASDLRSKLGKGFDVVTYTDESWAPFYVGTMNFLYVMGQFFVILILGAVALAIVNTTTLNLLERSKETGTLRAIGFSPRQLTALFVREAILLCVIAITIGVIAAYSIAAVVNTLNIQFRPPGPPGSIQFTLVIHPGIALFMAVLVMAITVISTAVVVGRQGRTKVVNLLNDQGA